MIKNLIQGKILLSGFIYIAILNSNYLIKLE